MKLTMHQKKAIISCNYGISLYCKAFDDDDSYGDTESWKMLDVWLSEILNLDFKKDVYEGAFDLNKKESVKKAFCAKYPHYTWFIGDALTDVLYDLCRNNEQNDFEITATEEKILEMWEFFKKLNPEHFSNESYELVGELNGEKLYRKVNK